VNGNFYEERLFDKIAKYHMKIVLTIFQCQSRQGRYCQTTKLGLKVYTELVDSGIGTVNFATSKNLNAKTTIFLHRDIHKYI
jgi:hypothetical protein